MAWDRSPLADEHGGLGPKDRVVMREETLSAHGCRIFCRVHLQEQQASAGLTHGGRRFQSHRSHSGRVTVWFGGRETQERRSSRNSSWDALRMTDKSMWSANRFSTAGRPTNCSSSSQRGSQRGSSGGAHSCRHMAGLPCFWPHTCSTVFGRHTKTCVHRKDRHCIRYFGE